MHYLFIKMCNTQVCVFISKRLEMHLQSKAMKSIIISRGKKTRPIWRPTQIHQHHKQISYISKKKEVKGQ